MTETLIQAQKIKMKRPFHEEVFPLIDQNIKKFIKLTYNHFCFHAGFLTFTAIQFLLVSFLFSYDTHSFFLAILLALFFFTLFSYFILQIYFRGKGEEKMLELLDAFILECQEFIPHDWAEIEYHSLMSYGLRKFAEGLNSKKARAYPFLRSFFYHRFYWKNFFKMKEHLLQGAVQEHIEMVKIAPLNVEVHASLANAYVVLSLLYTQNELQPNPFEEKFKQVIVLAIEEFEIVKEFAPNDPWVYSQLAYGWKELNMPEKEIDAYETIVHLRPGDLDSLFYLGTLYFSYGMNSKGLEIYDTLRKLDEGKAIDLIGYYGNNYSHRF